MCHHGTGCTSYSICATGRTVFVPLDAHTVYLLCCLVALLTRHYETII